MHVHRPSSEQFQGFHSEDEYIEEGEDEGLRQHAAALQTAHSSRLRANHYAVPLDTISRFTSNSLEVFTQVSFEWHQFLDFNDTYGSGKGKGKETLKRQHQSTHEDIMEQGLLQLPNRNLSSPIKRQRSHTKLSNDSQPVISGGQSQFELETMITKSLRERFSHKFFKS